MNLPQRCRRNLGANNAQYFLFVVAIFNFETKESVAVVAT